MQAVLALDIPAEKMRVNPNATREHLELVCEEAVGKYQADGVILGCLGMAGYGDELERKYPVRYWIRPYRVAYAEMCVRLGLRHIPAQYHPFTNESNVEL
ncbi:MAG: aspartate/glutamate racemase family protein [Blautia wexlerae]